MGVEGDWGSHGNSYGNQRLFGERERERKGTYTKSS